MAWDICGLENNMEKSSNNYKSIFYIMIVISVVFNILIYIMSEEKLIFAISMVFSVVVISLFAVYQNIIKSKVVDFSNDIEKVIDDMITGKSEIEFDLNSETLFSKINFKLKRLYEIIDDQSKRNLKEKLELEELVSDVSHQVKTPLTNLKMISTTVTREDISVEKKKDLMRVFNNQIKKLEFLIYALIKASRLETGVIELNSTMLPIYDTIAEALGGIIFKAEEKDIDVKVNCDTNIKLKHDKKWIAEALFNILDNATKYTGKNGSIFINVEELENHVKITISDTGKGIEKEHFNDIFKRFYREQSNHSVDGIGIGLYLTREIISKQGGYVQVDSKVGKGSTFSVLLFK